MSYWNNHIKEMDKIIAENLPEEWKEKLTAGEIELCDVPSDVRCEAFKKGEPDYWGGMTDAIHERVRRP